MLNSSEIMKYKVDLNDKVVVIFGSSVGIGAATAEIMAKSGAKVVLASRNIALTEKNAKNIKDEGYEAKAIKVDVTNFAEVKSAVDLATQSYGGLDIVVNNAGINETPAQLHNISDEIFDKIMNTNLKGVFYGMKAALPEIIKRGSGAVVNVSSVGGLVGAPGISPYCASKHAVIGLSKSAALDYADNGIRVNIVSPGAIDTAIFNDWQESEEAREAFIALHPLGRVGQPEEIGAAIAWLASDAAGYVTGAVLPIDGGYIIP
jgi:NAD(P)-dependent dehydrogenase (short-subunit alcohol dehydrogenase family)